MKHYKHIGFCLFFALGIFFLSTYLAKRNAVGEQVRQKEEEPVVVVDVIAGEKREASANEITVIAIPEVLPDGRTRSFAVELSTHSAELSMDLVKDAEITLPDGRTLQPERWEGDPPSGHHRSGRLVFPEMFTVKRGITLNFSLVQNEEPIRLMWNVR